MEKKEFAIALEKRTRIFAIMIFRISKGIPKGIEENIIKNQIVKSGTSIGANYREANRSRSKADFASRIKICESETSETIYWLELIEELELINVNEIMNEAGELLAIFSTISKKLKQ